MTKTIESSEAIDMASASLVRSVSTSSSSLSWRDLSVVQREAIEKGAGRELKGGVTGIGEGIGDEEREEEREGGSELGSISESEVRSESNQT